LEGRSTDHPEIRREPVVPRGLKVRHLQIARDQRALQVEAQHDVEVVMHLVGLGPDEARRDG
jgi:hypothetical protein